MDGFGKLPWQEGLIFLGAFVIWYAVVTVICIATRQGRQGGRLVERIIYAWTLAWLAICVAAYGYVLNSGGLTALLGS